MNVMPELPSPIRIHYHRPPSDLTVYSQTLVHEDSRVKVSLARDLALPKPVRVDGEIILENGSDAVWFTFPGLWHDIGRFHRADGSFTGIYANIITPCVFQPGGDWETTDLFLDLWIPSLSPSTQGQECAGATVPRLLDEDELRAAVDARDLDPALASRAMREAGSLLRAAERGEWPPPVVSQWTRTKCLEDG